VTDWLPEGTTTWGGRPVAHTVATAKPRARVHLHATVTAVRSRQAGTANGPLAGVSHGAVVEAVVDDGTGTVVLRWLGRSGIAGMVPGAVLEVEGTVATVWGKRMVLNPLYRFIGRPTPVAPRP
jgi:hypothetical protein